METLSFAIEDIVRFKDDEDAELSIAHVNFFSNRPNAHKINITEEMLRRDASTILGKFVVAKMNAFDNDCMGHEKDERIMGYFPKEQKVDFWKTDDGYVVASADAVISKLYATSFYDMFTKKNGKSVSIEMRYSNPKELEDGSIDIDGFSITAATTLGDVVRPACSDANMSIIRFSEEAANEFYHKQHEVVNSLQKFVENRRLKMAEAKNYKINKIELKDIDWGNVDKTELRNKIMDAKNRKTLVKNVYALVEDGWEEAPSEKLKYPLMAEIEGVFYYVRGALSSALAYARQNDEQAVIDKIKGLYDKFDLADSDEKEEDGEMSETKNFAVDIGNLWCQIWDVLEQRYPDKEYGSIYRVKGIYEEDNQKFVVIYRKDEVELYRLDFDLNETGLSMAEEMVAVEVEFVSKEEIRKFEMPEDGAKYCLFEKEEPKEEELKDENKEMACGDEQEERDFAAELEEKDHIIMEQEEELKALRQFKADVEEKEKMAQVDDVMAQVKGHLSDDEYQKFSQSGCECSFADIDTWKNGVFAAVGAATLKFSIEETNGFRMEGKYEQPKVDIWANL